MTGLLQNIVGWEGFVNSISTFCDKVTAKNKVMNGYNLCIALVITSATFDNVHLSQWIRAAQRCEPLYICKQMGQLAKLRGKIKDNSDLSWTKAWLI